MLLSLKAPLFILSCRVLKQQSTYNRYFYLTTLILVNSANAAISFQAVGGQILITFRETWLKETS